MNVKKSPRKMKNCYTSHKIFSKNEKIRKRKFSILGQKSTRASLRLTREKSHTNFIENLKYRRGDSLFSKRVLYSNCKLQI